MQKDSRIASQDSKMASPLKVPTIYLKDKQAFAKSEGVMRLLGPAVECIKNLAKRYKLFHIVDLDLKKGNAANFDIYDKLTYFTHIQVECENEEAADRLVRIMARVVVRLPTTLQLEKLNKKLLVGEISDIDTKNMGTENLKELEKQIEMVGDIIIPEDIAKVVFAKTTTRLDDRRSDDRIIEKTGEMLREKILRKNEKRIMIKLQKKEDYAGQEYAGAWAIILPEP